MKLRKITCLVILLITGCALAACAGNAGNKPTSGDNNILEGNDKEAENKNMFNLNTKGKEKYKLELDGYGFESKKDSYAEGEKVTVYFNLIATDTDYNFYTEPDDVKLDRDYDDKHGYIFTFEMPAHDVKISVNSWNSMVRSSD